MSLLKNNLIPSLLTAIGFILISSGGVFGQQNQPQSQKYDEFIAEADYEDILARLDFFSIELKKHPQAKAHIIVYRTRSAPADVGRQYANNARDYLIKTRGMDPGSVLTVDGGMTGCLTYELWIVPPGAQPPERRFTYEHTREGTIDWKPTPKPKRKRPQR